MANRIRVLIVDDNDETRDGTRRLLEYEDDIEVVDYAENGLIAIEKVRELDPDVVLMDINMPVMDGLTATQRLRAEFPRTQIVIVTVQDDAHYMRQAMRAGVADFVAKPVGADELADAIRRAYSKIPTEPVAPPSGASAPTPVMPGYGFGQPHAAGRVITVLGLKGGVGKTTIAVNLGVALARANPDKKVLIVDTNLYFGDVAVFLNTRGQHNVSNMLSMAESPEDIDPTVVDSILLAHESGVKLLIAPPNPSDVSFPTSPTPLINMVDYLKTRFDYIIVDTGTYFDNMLSGAIQVADRFLLITTATMPAVKDARLMLNELRSNGYSVDQVILVVNQFERTSRITPEQIVNYLKCPTTHVIPFDSIANEALNRGIPLVTSDPRRSTAARPLMELAGVVRQSFEATEAERLASSEQRRGGLFRTLRGG